MKTQFTGLKLIGGILKFLGVIGLFSGGHQPGRAAPGFFLL